MNNIQRIREKLAKGALCFGTHCSTTDADFYEMCGLLGYDYVWIDNEHAGMTQPMIKMPSSPPTPAAAAPWCGCPTIRWPMSSPSSSAGPTG